MLLSHRERILPHEVSELRCAFCFPDAFLQKPFRLRIRFMFSKPQISERFFSVRLHDLNEFLPYYNRSYNRQLSFP